MVARAASKATATMAGRMLTLPCVLQGVLTPRSFKPCELQGAALVQPYLVVGRCRQEV